MHDFSVFLDNKNYLTKKTIFKIKRVSLLNFTDIILKYVLSIDDELKNIWLM